ncbi:MAG: (2Fe-2S)-binding protein [Elusimicrobiota bacterium]|nr:(2Fe-2S)-binding protein [Elusimicrobiota bacterium]
MGPRKNHAKIVCECLGITEGEVVAAIRAEGLTTVKQVTACTDAGGGCTSCHPAIRALLERRAKEVAAQGAAPAAYLPASSPIFSAK